MIKGKTILVTGGAGFIGSHLCERLIMHGNRVISLDNYLAGTVPDQIFGVEYREGHTKDVATLVPERIDMIYHLGEYARVEQSLFEPAMVWDANIRGTFAILEYWRDRRCNLIYAGSSTKFADGGLGRDMSPYTFFKATNTELVCNYSEWYGLPFAITYFYNVYGPHERSGKYGTLIESYNSPTALPRGSLVGKCENLGFRLYSRAWRDRRITQRTVCTTT
jgi:UDP-glucose 4-epimerase